MPLQSIIVIILRLFAIQWIINAVMFIINFVPLTQSAKFHGFNLVIILHSAIYALLALGVICFSRPIARLITRREDHEIQFSKLTLYHLYCVAFLWIGISQSISALPFLLGSVLQIITAATALPHPLIQSSSVDENTVQFVKSGLQVFFGVLLVIFSNHWAAKLASREMVEKVES